MKTLASNLRLFSSIIFSPNILLGLRIASNAGLGILNVLEPLCKVHLGPKLVQYIQQSPQEIESTNENLISFVFFSRTYLKIIVKIV